METDLEEVTRWEQFHERLRDPVLRRLACRLSGALCPFHWSPVDPLELLSQARDDPRARILRQPVADRLDLSADHGQEMRSMPVEEVAREPDLHLSLFDLDGLCRPGQVLHRFHQEVIAPLEQLWQENGLGWEPPFWPILFIGGTCSATNYHIDPTPNAIFHLFGSKRFHSLKEPDRWCSPAVKQAYLAQQTLPVMPDDLGEDDCLVHENWPGDLVWIPELTPHWVHSGSLSATITFAFRQFRWADLRG